jgi:DNA helicase-2/ATP-dependent DNA helicase PcrA
MSRVPLSELNPPQREAASYEGGPLLVLAGAGSGKTRVVTYRIARLILDRGVSPGRILAVTFTNKAAREMMHRIERMTGPQARGLWIGTFHSMCARMLRRHADRLGYSRDFTIYDTDEQKALIKNLVKELRWDSEKFQPAKVKNRISHAKNHLISPRKMAEQSRQPDAYTMAELYERYQEALKQANAVDFDDLLNLTVELLADQDDVRLMYQMQFEHLIVDEYQDTNEPQDIITRVLAQPQNNLCVVGDDDQSIYRWRGARFKNILELPNLYKNLKIVRLEQNYRSTPNILNAAKSVIAKNKDRHQKEIWTDRESGEPIRLLGAETEEEEAREVVSLIGESLREGVSPREIGVLYRTNAQSRVLEEALLRQRIPYRIIGGFAFYQRKEIKVLLSYMKMLIHPHDDLSFLRIVNNPRRGIGQTTLRQLQAKAGSLQVSLFETAKNSLDYDEITPAGSRRLESLCSQVRDWAGKLEERSLAETLNTIVKDIDYLEALREEDKAKAESRIENVNELINAFLTGESEITYEAFRPWDTENHQRTPSRAEKLEVFLERATLQSSAEEGQEEEDTVSLMTLHAAKGLEFSRVFMTGLEEGLFPHEQSMQDSEELEEERRLCYVGMTRAKDVLTLSYAHNRRIWGTSTPGVVSRFLKEIPSQLLHPIGIVRRPQAMTQPLPMTGGGGWESRPGARRGNPSRFAQAHAGGYSNRPPAKAPEASVAPKKAGAPLPDFLKPGRMVRHRTFGIGQVLSTEGEDPTWRVTVNFKIVGMKTLVQKYAKLEPAS